MAESVPSLPRERFFSGNIKSFSRDPIGYVLKHMQEERPIYHVPLPFYRIFVVNDPDIIRHVLQTNNKNYVKSFDYDFIKLFLGKGLLTNEGDSWLNQRRIIQPAFHRTRLDGFLGTMIGSTEKLLQKWEGREQRGGAFDLVTEMMELTAAIAMRSLFSAELQGDTDRLRQALNVLNRYVDTRITQPLSMPLWVPTHLNRSFRQARRDVDSFVLPLIEARRQGNQEHHDLLAMLMEARDGDTGQGMSDQQLRDEVVTLFLAGHETSSSALSWTFLLLDQHPEVEKLLLEELNTVLGGRSPGLEDLKNLVYTRQVLDESMRVYPPAWAIGRRSLKDDHEGKFFIPKNTHLYLFPYSVHRDPRLWEDPDAFRPDRFAPGAGKERHRFAYFPFGGGPRICIGNNFAIMEMTVVLAMILQKFHIRVEKNQKIELDTLITLSPRGGIQVSLQRR